MTVLFSLSLIIPPLSHMLRPSYSHHLEKHIFVVSSLPPCENQPVFTAIQDDWNNYRCSLLLYLLLTKFSCFFLFTFWEATFNIPTRLRISLSNSSYFKSLIRSIYPVRNSYLWFSLLVTNTYFDG